jgi:hypothetical protein
MKTPGRAYVWRVSALAKIRTGQDLPRQAQNVKKWSKFLRNVNEHNRLKRYKFVFEINDYIFPYIN